MVGCPGRFEGYALDEFGGYFVEHTDGFGEAVLYVAVAVEELGYCVVLEGGRHSRE